MLHPWNSHQPQLHETAYVAPGVHLIGQVELAEHASVWFNSVLRADLSPIRIGRYSNIQDLSVAHVGDDHPVTVGEYAVVGHAARIHGCTILDRSLIGIGAIVLNGAVVGSECIVGAGSLVPEGAVLEPGMLYVGSPAKARRPLSDKEKAGIIHYAEKYARLAARYKSP